MLPQEQAGGRDPSTVSLQGGEAASQREEQQQQQSTVGLPSGAGRTHLAAQLLGQWPESCPLPAARGTPVVPTGARLTRGRQSQSAAASNHLLQGRQSRAKRAFPSRRGCVRACVRGTPRVLLFLLLQSQAWRAICIWMATTGR